MPFLIAVFFLICGLMGWRDLELVGEALGVAVAWLEPVRNIPVPDATLGSEPPPWVPPITGGQPGSPPTRATAATPPDRRGNLSGFNTEEVPEAGVLRWSGRVRLIKDSFLFSEPSEWSRTLARLDVGPPLPGEYDRHVGSRWMEVTGLTNGYVRVRLRRDHLLGYWPVDAVEWASR